MTNAYTPGPWQFIPPASHRPSRVGVAGPRGNDIYDAPLTNETEANARLIAAAPDLLAACEEAWKFLFAADDCGDVRKVVEQLTAAINKADGR